MLDSLVSQFQSKSQGGEESKGQIVKGVEELNKRLLAGRP